MIDRYDSWIFDWSGTIVDDMALVIDATNHVMRQYAKPEFDRDGFKSSFRLPYGDWYAQVIPGVALDEIEDHFRHGFSVSGVSVPVLPHTREMLQFLRQRGDRLFVCTSMDPKAFIEQAEQHDLMEFFEKTYSGVLDKRDLIGELLAEHELQLESTVFVGDMIHDIETAHHGGIASIAILTGYNTEAELRSVSPTHLVADYSQML